MVQKNRTARLHYKWEDNIQHSSTTDPGSTTDPDAATNPGSAAGTGQGMDYIDETAIFGGRNFSMVSNHFIGGKITAIFGGFTINLLNCTPAQGCTIDLANIFGGTKLIVPPDWNIKMEVTAIAGGFEDKRKNLSREIDPSKTLIIKGTCHLWRR